MRLKNAHTTEIRVQTSREYKKEVSKQFRKYYSDLVLNNFKKSSIEKQWPKNLLENY